MLFNIFATNSRLRFLGKILEFNEEDNKKYKEYCDIIKNSMEEMLDLFEKDYLPEDFKLAWEDFKDSSSTSFSPIIIRLGKKD